MLVVTQAKLDICWLPLNRALEVWFDAQQLSVPLLRRRQISRKKIDCGNSSQCLYVTHNKFPPGVILPVAAHIGRLAGLLNLEHVSPAIRLRTIKNSKAINLRQLTARKGLIIESPNVRVSH
jgi:hypothetical protein